MVTNNDPTTTSGGITNRRKKKRNEPEVPMSEWHPAWVRKHDVYSAMGDSLFAVPPGSKMKSQRPPSPNPVRPKPSANLFYEKSRYYYEPPVEPKERLCTSKVCCAGDPAVIKCHSCVKFDSTGKGWYCQRCFDKHHPWYRDKHQYCSIEEDDDMQYDLVKQNYQAECDRVLKGIGSLIDGVKTNIKSCENMATDFRPDDLMKESAQTIETATRRVWEMKHFVRGQLLASGEDRRVRNLEMDDEIKTLKETIPYRTRGGMTPYARRLHGDGARQPKRRSSLAMGKSDLMSEETAAIIIQTRVRRALAKNEILARVAMNYQKVWNWKYMRYYYVNLRQQFFDEGEGVRKEDSQYATWGKPPGVNEHNESALLTPRSYYDMYGTSKCADLMFTSKPPLAETKKRKEEERERRKKEKEEEEQRKMFEIKVYNKRRELIEAGEVDEVIEKAEEEMKKEESLAVGGAELIASEMEEEKKDDNTKIANSEAAPSSEAATALTSAAAGSGTKAVTAINRSRKMHSLIAEQHARMKERIMRVNLRSKQLILHQEALERRGGITREDASRKLQSSCRIWLARRELSARAVELIVRIKPHQSKAMSRGGRKAKTYYFNFRLNKATWVKPKALGSRDIRDVTNEEATRRLRKFIKRGGKVVTKPLLTYPISKPARDTCAAIIIQKIVRSFLARGLVDWIVWDQWKEDVDAESGELFWSNSEQNRAQWEEPWSPKVTLARLRGVKRCPREFIES